jgi:hypothetical protein
MDAFIKDTTVAALADNRRFELVEVSTNNPVPTNLMPLVTAGAIARGRLRTPRGYEVWLFTYVDVYTDDSGSPQQYLPDGSALLAFFGARCDRYFGPPERLPLISTDMAMYSEMLGMNMMAPMMPANVNNISATVNPAMFYCDAYRSTDNKKIAVRTQSAPIFATTQTDAFVTFTGLIDDGQS